MDGILDLAEREHAEEAEEMEERIRDRLRREPTGMEAFVYTCLFRIQDHREGRDG